MAATIPRLVFEEVDQNNEAQKVKPDKSHVYMDDYHTYEGASPKTSTSDFTKLDNAEDPGGGNADTGLEIAPRSENVENDMDRNDTVCSIAKLNETDYVPMISRSRSQEDLHNQDSVFMPSLDFSYDPEPVHTSPSLVHSPFYPAQNLGADEDGTERGGLWFKGHTPLPSDEVRVYTVYNLSMKLIIS